MTASPQGEAIISAGQFLIPHSSFGSGFRISIPGGESKAEASVEGEARAAGGGESEPRLTAAVEKRKEKRKPAAFFGNRKVEGEARAAGGGESEPRLTAAVEKRKE